MAQILSFSLTTKVILVGAWLVLTLVLGIVLFRSGSDVASARILIHLSDELENLNLHFGLLHVRDGKDEVVGPGLPLNDPLTFRPVDRSGTMEVTVNYTRSLGFQFKCFVDQGANTYERLEQLLKESGFVEISKGRGQKFRTWFILNDYPTVKTVDGFINNFFYPS